MALCDRCASPIPLLTLEAAATLLACSPDWIRRAVARGTIPEAAIVRVGNRLRFHRTELLDALGSGKAA